MHTGFISKAEEKRPLWTSRHRWEYNIKMNFNQIGCKGMDYLFV
jgi:hypothetical protein